MPVPYLLGPASHRYLGVVLFLVTLWLPHIAGAAEVALSVTPQASHTPSTLMSVQFQTVQNGWVVGTGGTILRTTDGGKRWKRMASGTSTLLTAIFFADSSNGWVTGAGGFLSRTTNGGESWSQQALDTQQPLYAVSFSSLTVGWVVGGGGTIFHTTDGGQHWTEQVSGTTAALYAAHFLSDQKGTIVGALGNAAVRQRLIELGQEIPAPEQLTPQALGAYQKAEIEKWWPVIKAAGITAQ